MRANREMILKEIDRVMAQVIEKSVRVDNYYVEYFTTYSIKLTIYDSWDNIIDYTIGDPYDVLCVAKSWLYPLLK